MAFQNSRFINSVPSLVQPLATVFPAPVVAKRAPVAGDTGYPIGQLWIDTTANLAYILTSVAGGAANWLAI